MRVQDKYILYHQAVHDLVFKPPYNKLYMVCGSVCFQLWQMIPRPSHIIIWILAFKKYFSTALNRNIVLRKLKKKKACLAFDHFGHPLYKKMHLAQSTNDNSGLLALVEVCALRVPFRFYLQTESERGWCSFLLLVVFFPLFTESQLNTLAQQRRFSSVFLRVWEDFHWCLGCISFLLPTEFGVK